MDVIILPETEPIFDDYGLLAARPAHVKPGAWHNLSRFANMVSSLFGGDAYLVGSARRAANTDPRDWDIRLLLSDKRFCLRYAPRQALKDDGVASMVMDFTCRYRSGLSNYTYWRWADEMARMSDMGRRQTNLNIDFQVHPTHLWLEHDDPEKHPRVRLDTRDAYLKSHPQAD